MLGKRLRRWLWPTALTILAAIANILYSGVSFIYYPITLPDPNCYLTVGRAMAAGKVMYKDIFDQKGPWTYFLHWFTITITPNQGDYGYLIFDIFFTVLILWFAYKIMRLYLSFQWSALLTPVYLVLIMQPYFYPMGDTVEITCMPVMLAAIYLVLRQVRQPDRLVHWWESGLLGVGLSWILWTKFSLILLPGVATLVLITYVWRAQGAPEALRHIIWGVIGALLPTIPVIIYFAVNHAFSYLFHYYFVVNLTAYSPASRMILPLAILRGMTYGIFHNLTSNWGLGIAGVLFFLSFFVGPVAPRRWGDRLAIFLPFFAGLFAVAYPQYGGYYVYPDWVIAPIAAVTGAWLLVKAFPMLKGWQLAGRHLGFAWTGVAFTLLLVLASLNTTPRQSWLYNKDKPVFDQFVAPIRKDPNQDASLMLYNVMDQGFYYFAGNKIPPTRYFTHYNIKDKQFPELKQNLNKRLRARSVDYVITRHGTARKYRKFKVAKVIKQNYRLIKTLPYWGMTYDLYQAKK